MVKNHLDGSAFAATVKKTQKKLLPRDEVTTQHFEDGSTFQGQTSKFGVFEGHGTYEIGSNGDAYTGDFLHGRFHGHGHIWYTNDDVFDGEFVDGVKNGAGTMRFHDGSSYIGSLSMGLFEGVRLRRYNAIVYPVSLYLYHTHRTSIDWLQLTAAVR